MVERDGGTILSPAYALKFKCSSMFRAIAAEGFRQSNMRGCRNSGNLSVLAKMKLIELWIISGDVILQIKSYPIAKIVDDIISSIWPSDEISRCSMRLQNRIFSATEL